MLLGVTKYGYYGGIKYHDWYPVQGLYYDSRTRVPAVILKIFKGLNVNGGNGSEFQDHH